MNKLKKIRLSAFFDEDIAAQVDRIAREMNVTMSSVLKWAVHDFLTPARHIRSKILLENEIAREAMEEHEQT